MFFSEYEYDHILISFFSSFSKRVLVQRWCLRLLIFVVSDFITWIKKSPTKKPPKNLFQHYFKTKIEATSIPRSLRVKQSKVPGVLGSLKKHTFFVVCLVIWFFFKFSWLIFEWETKFGLVFCGQILFQALYLLWSHKGNP